MRAGPPLMSASRPPKAVRMRSAKRSASTPSGFAASAVDSDFGSSAGPSCANAHGAKDRVMATSNADNFIGSLLGRLGCYICLSVFKAVFQRGLMTVLQHAFAGAFLLVAAFSPVSAQQTVSNEFFEAKIRPVLAAKCYACHNSKMKEPKGYLTLDSREGVMKGGTLGPAIVPGKPGESKLIHAMKYVDPHLQMPPSGKLADEVIADFETWIAGGAPDPRTDSGVSAVTKRRVVDERSEERRVG